MERSIKSYENSLTFKLQCPQNWYTQKTMRIPRASPLILYSTRFSLFFEWKNHSFIPKLM